MSGRGHGQHHDTSFQQNSHTLEALHQYRPSRLGHHDDSCNPDRRHDEALLQHPGALGNGSPTRSLLETAGLELHALHISPHHSGLHHEDLNMLEERQHDLRDGALDCHYWPSVYIQYHSWCQF